MRYFREDVKNPHPAVTKIQALEKFLIDNKMRVRFAYGGRVLVEVNGEEIAVRDREDGSDVDMLPRELDSQVLVREKENR